MNVAQLSQPRGNWELIERDIPAPGPGQVRIKVEACGVCHSDMLVKDGLWPGLKYPRVPGHEIAKVPRRADDELNPYTLPIHLRSSHTAFNEVRFRRSKTFLAAAKSLPRLRLFHASLVLMATNWSTLGSR